MVLEPLNGAPSLSERVYAAIKDAILSLKIQPGELLNIGRLAEQLGVSRTPVRDALLALERESLVTIMPQKGATVSVITSRDAEEIFELRIILETYAARVGTALLTMEELDRTEAVLTEARQAFGQGQAILAADLGRSIHDLLVRKVGNNRLVKALNDLEVHYIRIRHFAAGIPSRFEHSHSEHHAILAALRDGDGERAARLTEEHLSSVRADILANIGHWGTNLDGGKGRRLAPVVFPGRIGHTQEVLQTK